MQREGMLLLVHGEVTDPTVDVFDREAVFIERVLRPLRRDFPELKIVFEHITTREAAQFVADSRRRHGGDDHRAPPAVQPQRALHRRPAPALLLPAGAQARSAPPGAGGGGHFAAARSSSSAPTARRMPRTLKEASVGCAGCYTAPAALELYAEAFEAAGALDKLEGLRQLPRRRLLRPAAQPRPRHAAQRAWTLPESVPFGDSAAEAAARRRDAALEAWS